MVIPMALAAVTPLLTEAAPTAATAVPEFTFGPTGYALLTLALFALLWRFLRPPKGHRHNTHKWPWE